jgi:hypothetical protein
MAKTQTLEIIALSTIAHDGDVIGEGELLTLPEADAMALVACGAAMLKAKAEAEAEAKAKAGD